LLRVNRYLFIFLAITGVFYALLAIFVQSNFFGRIVTRELEKRVFDRTSFSGSFKNIKVALIPPSTTINELKIQAELDGGKILNGEIESATIELSLFSLFTNEIVIDSIQLQDSVFVLSNNKELSADEAEQGASEKLKSSPAPVAKSDVLAALRGAIDFSRENTPVQINSVSVRDLIFVEGGRNLFLDSAELELFENFIALRAALSNLDVDGLTNQEIFKENVDSLFVEAELTRNEINLREITIASNLDILSMSGRYGLHDEVLSVVLNVRTGVERFSDIIEEHINEWMTGYAEVQVIANGKINDLSGEFYVDLHDFESNFIVLDYARISGQSQDGLLSVNSLEARHSGGSVQLEDRFEIYNIREKKIILSDVVASIEKVSTHSGLYVIRDIFEDVYGELNGTVRVSFLRETGDIGFYTEDGFYVDNFRLASDELVILGSDRVVLGGSQVILREDKTVAISANLQIEDSLIYAGGEIGDGKIAIDLRSPRLDLETIGPIAGVAARGVGPWEIRIGESLDDVKFKIETGLENFSILDFVIDRLNGELVFELGPMVINLNDLKGSHGDAEIDIVGWVDFKNRNGFSLTYLVKDLDFDEARVSIAPVFSLLPFDPAGLKTEVTTAGRVWGSFVDDSINSQGKFSTSQINYAGEAFDGLSMDYSFIDERFRLTNVYLKKGVGGLRGRFFLNGETDFIEYDAQWLRTPLKEFRNYEILNLGLDGELVADFYGSGLLNELTTRTQVRIENSMVESVLYESSDILIYNEEGRFYVSASLLGLGRVESTITPGQNEQSSLTLDFISDDIRLPLGILAKRNLLDSTLGGSASFRVTSQFLTANWRTMDLDFTLRELLLRKRGAELRSRRPVKIELKNGEFITSGIRIPGSGDYFLQLGADGNLNSSFNILANFNMPASFMEVFSDEVEFAQGDVRGEIHLLGSRDVASFRTQLEGENILLQLADVPGSIERVAFEITSHNNDILLERLTAFYGKGEVRGGGAIKLKFPFPELKLNFNIDNSYIPFMNRSGVVLSGALDLGGDTPPYKLEGALDVLFGEVLEEISEFEAGADDLRAIQRFLPRTESHNPGLLMLDLDIRVRRPILARNNMLELYLEGGGKVRGTSEMPTFEGSITTIPNSSKFKFKGHEFNLSRGLIEFDRNYLRDGPYLDFSGISIINDYRVRLDVSGRTKTITVSLSSEPALSQEDIFSLLTLGVTSDISQALDESERQSVATVGIGTLLADQFRLNEGLDSSFGLRLSVLPEFAPEETSLLQGKSAVSETGASRFRSATRVRLQKKLTDRVDLSVSSTVGGSLDTRQEMNINFRINNRWSLEGVYELRSTDDEGVESTDSLGADLKYRWTF
jgi:translocation and assembly module TamB